MPLFSGVYFTFVKNSFYNCKNTYICPHTNQTTMNHMIDGDTGLHPFSPKYKGPEYEAVTCSECNGDGLEYVFDAEGNHLYTMARWCSDPIKETQKCSCCNGEGVIWI